MTETCQDTTRVLVAGSYNLDLVFRCESLPKPGQTTSGHFEQGHGGKGFNQALACHRLQAHTRFMACLGDDAHGEAIQRWAESQGLDCLWQQGTHPTGTAAVLTDASGENSIVVAAGANQQFNADQALAMLESEPDEARIWLLQREIPDACNRRLIQAASDSDCIILNPAPMDDAFETELLQGVDILTPNETEFEQLLQRVAGVTLPRDWTRLPDQQLDRYCRTLAVPVVIITLGAAGCFVSVDAASDLWQDSCGRHPACAVEAVVDTTGAGDAFNGALAAGLSRHSATLETALALALQVAGHAVSQPGAASAMPTLAQLNPSLEENRP